MVKEDENAYAFAKLKGNENYKEWAREMEFALKDAGLMDHINDDDEDQPTEYTKEQKELYKRTPEGEDRLERRKEIIKKWKTNDARVVGKIGRMCTKTVQMEFKPEWNAKITWNSLKERYTPQGWSSKWAVLNRLEETTYENSSNVPDFGRKMRTVKEEIKDLNISIDDYVTIKVINSMGSGFETYVTVLNEQARKDKKLPDLDELLKSLEEEENRMKATAIVAAVHNGRGGYRGRGGRGGLSDRSNDRSNSYMDDGSGRPYCKICFHNHEEGQCFHDRAECYGCHKKGHIQRNCPDTESTSPASQSRGGSTDRKQVIGMIRNIAQFSPTEESEIQYSGWILDSGCTTHVCNNRSRFIDSSYKKHTEAVQTATGQIVMSYGKGSVAINLAVTGVKLLLKEVLHVPEVEHNYMSMNALSKRKLDVFFHHVQPKLMQNNDVIGYIDKLKGRYELYGIREEEGTARVGSWLGASVGARTMKDLKEEQEKKDRTSSPWQIVEKSKWKLNRRMNLNGSRPVWRHEGSRPAWRHEGIKT